MKHPSSGGGNDRRGNTTVVFDKQRLVRDTQAYLSQDDEEWIDLSIFSSRVDELIDRLDVIKENMLTKKLRYAVHYDENLVNVFKKVVEGEFQSLTRNELEKVKERVSKGRTVNRQDIQKLIRDIIKEANIQAQKAIEDVFKPLEMMETPKVQNKQSRNQDNAKKVEKPERPPKQEPVRGKKEQPQQRRRERSGDREREVQAERPRRGNRATTARSNANVPKLTVAEVKSNGRLKGNFEITLKIIKVRKTFKVLDSVFVDTISADETGQIQASFRRLPFVKKGAVLHLDKAKIFYFHNTQTIQMDIAAPCTAEPADGLSDVEQLSSDEEEREVNRRLKRKDYGSRSKDTNQNSRPTRPNREMNERPRESRNREGRNRRDDNEEGWNHVGKKGTFKKQERVDHRRAPPSSSSDQSDYEPPKKVEKQPSKSSLSIQPKRQNPRQQLGKSPSKLKVEWTKIEQIEPGDEDINIMAEVYEIIEDEQLNRKNEILCRIADSTGIVRASLPKHYACVTEGTVIAILLAESEVDQDSRITVRLTQKGSCERMNIELRNLNTENDMSSQQWQEDESEEEEEEKEAGDLSMVGVPNQGAKQKVQADDSDSDSSGDWGKEADNRAKGVVEDL